jgi:cobalt-zinc-cadmium efflux system outer membrane protein
VSVGEAARLELVRAETEVATARTVLRSSQLNRMTALAVLRSAIGAAPDEELQPVGNLSAHLPLPDLETLREGMLQRHPALLQARANVATAESKVKMEMVSRKPQPSLYADYEHQPDLGFARVGIQIPLPIWNKREGPIAEAVAERNRLRAVHQVQETQLTAELERAYGQYQVATQQLESFQQGVLPEAEAALRAAEAAFRYGERGIIEVLDAQRVLRSVRFDYLNAQYDLQAALIDLEQLRAIDTVDHP